MQAAGHFVELLVTGRKARNLPLVLVQLLDGLNGIIHMRPDLLHILSDAHLANCKNLFFHIVDEELHITLLLVTACRRGGADSDHLTKQILFLDDIEVVLGIGGGR